MYIIYLLENWSELFRLIDLLNILNLIVVNIGESNILDGDDRFYNNIFMHSTGLSEYDQKNSFPFLWRKSFLKNAKSLKNTKKPQHDFNADIRFNIERNLNEYFKF